MCDRYIVLHDYVTSTLTEALATIHQKEESSSSDRLLKGMDTSTKALFAIDEQLSGYHIFKFIEDSASTQKYDTDIELLYNQWTSIKRTTTNSIREFAAHVQTDDAKFDGTEYKVNSKSLSCRWRKGLGSDF